MGLCRPVLGCKQFKFRLEGFEAFGLAGWVSNLAHAGSKARSFRVSGSSLSFETEAKHV